MMLGCCGGLSPPPPPDALNMSKITADEILAGGMAGVNLNMTTGKKGDLELEGGEQDPEEALKRDPLAEKKWKELIKRLETEGK